MNQQYGNPEIKQLLDQMWDTHCRKDADYAGEKSLGNFMQSEKVGVPAWKGAFIRMMDKWARVLNLLKRGGSGRVKDETIEETFLDLAVYALIVIVLRREKNRQKTQSFAEDLWNHEPSGSNRAGIIKK